LELGAWCVVLCAWREGGFSYGKNNSLRSGIFFPPEKPPSLPAGTSRQRESRQIPTLQHHGCQPAEAQQRQVVVQEGGNNRVPDVVVLTINVEASGGPKGGVGGG